MNHQGQLSQISSPRSSSEKANSSPNGTNSIWNDVLVDRLKGLFAKKYSGGRIAAELGLTRNTVIGKLFRLGLKSPSAPQHRVKRAPGHTPRHVDRRPKLKIVAGGGGSMRLIKTSETNLTPLRCVEIQPHHLQLSDLQRGDCRYPYGDGPFTFCGHPIDAGSSYCPSHRGLCRV